MPPLLSIFFSQIPTHFFATFTRGLNSFSTANGQQRLQNTRFWSLKISLVALEILMFFKCTMESNPKRTSVETDDQRMPRNMKLLLQGGFETTILQTTLKKGGKIDSFWSQSSKTAVLSSDMKHKKSTSCLPLLRLGKIAARNWLNWRLSLDKKRTHYFLFKPLLREGWIFNMHRCRETRCGMCKAWISEVQHVIDWFQQGQWAMVVWNAACKMMIFMVQTANHIVVEASKAANIFFLEPAELYVPGPGCRNAWIFSPKKKLSKSSKNRTEQQGGHIKLQMRRAASLGNSTLKRGQS